MLKVGKGNKSSSKPMDVLLLSLIYFQHGESMNYVVHMFHIIGPRFMTSMAVFMQKLEIITVYCFIGYYGLNHIVQYLVGNKENFNHFPYALEAVTSTLQQGNRSSGGMEGENLYFFCNHEVYGSKDDLSVQ